MRSLIFPLAGLAMIGAAHAATCNSGDEIRRYAKGGVAWRNGDVIVYSTPILKVDADGAPNSYRVDGKGLSYTCDGVAAIENGRRLTLDDKDWQPKCRAAWAAAQATGNYSNVAIFGFAKDAKTNQPIVQKAGDPLPGEAFITTTAIEISEAPEGTQRRYIDATVIPYIVLPQAFRQANNIKDGAVAAVYRPKTGQLAYAVFGDTGGSLNEASVKLHEELGGSPYAKSSGTVRAKNNITDNVLVVLFPDVASKPVLDSQKWRDDWIAKGRQSFEQWGGLDRVKACRQQQK